MRRLIIAALCGVVVGACSTQKPHVPSSDDSETGGTGGASGGMGGAVSGTFELEVNVVHSTGPSRYEPALGAHVRVDGSAAPVEVVADDDGHAVAVLEADSGPWDVTVAEPGRGPVSIIGVTGPIEGSVHLGNARGAPAPPTRVLSGSVTGRAFAESWVWISASGLRSFTPEGDTHSATLDVPKAPSVLRVLAAEREPADDGLPLNAVWLELEDTGEDLMADIELPSPARDVVETNLVLQTPTSGVVVGEGMSAIDGSATRVEDGFGYWVGLSSLEAAREGEGRFAWRVNAFDGDMAPTSVATTLTDAAGEGLIIAHADPSLDEVVTVAPAEVLEATGTTLETLSVAWSAPEHSHVGASLIGSEGGAEWFVYSYAGSELEARPWPRLPSAVTPADVGLDESEFGVNVFALTQSVGPWNWSSLADQRAVVRIQALEGGEGGAPGDGGAPDSGDEPDGGGDSHVDAYVGIYAITEITHNSMSCEIEGPLVTDPRGTTHFIAFDDMGRLAVLACFDAEDCRASAEEWRTEQTSPAPWFYPINGPDLPPAGDLYGRVPYPDGLCREETIANVTGTGAPGVSLRLEVHIVNVPAHERDTAGECSIEATDAAATGVECSELRVITGLYQEPP